METKDNVPIVYTREWIQRHIFPELRERCEIRKRFRLSSLLNIFKKKSSKALIKNMSLKRTKELSSRYYRKHPFEKMEENWSELTVSKLVHFFRVNGIVVAHMYGTYLVGEDYEIFRGDLPSKENEYNHNHPRPCTMDDLSQRVASVAQAEQWIREKVLN